MQSNLIQQIESELTNPAFHEDIKTFLSSGWRILKVLSCVVYFAIGQVYLWGQQFKAYVDNKMQPVKYKLYNACKESNHPAAQFVKGWLQSEVLTATLKYDTNTTTITQLHMETQSKPQLNITD